MPTATPDSPDPKSDDQSGPDGQSGTGPHRGSCACGAVRYRVTGELRPVSNCHCEPCRRTTGHHMAATACDSAALAFEADDTLRWWNRTETVRYGFCSNCGSSLFWQASDKQERISITAGSLDHPTGLHTHEALFVADAGDYFTPDTSLVQHEHDL